MKAFKLRFRKKIACNGLQNRLLLKGVKHIILKVKTVYVF